MGQPLQRFIAIVVIIFIVYNICVTAYKNHQFCESDDDCDDNYACRHPGNAQSENSRLMCRYCNCSQKTFCDMLANGYECNCSSAWTGQYCEIDVNECEEDLDDCPDPSTGGTCTNTEGSFTCGCCSGYTQTGSAPVQCQATDECSDGSHGCDVNADCTNLTPTCNADGTITGDLYSCTCRAGYTGDGTQSGTGCTDVDECTLETDDCPDPANGGTCSNTIGSFTCGCCGGYTQTGSSPVQCQATDECSDGSDDCDVNADCTNLTPTCNADGTVTGDTYSCTCRAGYSGDGTNSGTGCTANIRYCVVSYSAPYSCSSWWSPSTCYRVMYTTQQC